MRFPLGRQLISRASKTAIARAGSRRSSNPYQRSSFRSNAIRKKRPILQVDVDCGMSFLLICFNPNLFAFVALPPRVDMKLLYKILYI